jgi:hypothetical protein
LQELTCVGELGVEGALGPGKPDVFAAAKSPPVLLPCRDVFGTTLHRTSIFLRIEHFQEARVWTGKHDRVCNPCHHAKGQKQEPAAPATPCAALKRLALVVLFRDRILVKLFVFCRLFVLEWRQHPLNLCCAKGAGGAYRMMFTNLRYVA